MSIDGFITLLMQMIAEYIEAEFVELSSGHLFQGIR